MRPLYEIASNTFRETVRNNVLYLVLLFAVALIVLSVFVADWSVFARVQVMQDFGLATMSVSGLLLAAFIGVGLVGREVSQKTLYHVITKPVSRSLFVCGKFFGLAATLICTFAIMSTFFLATLGFLGGAITFQILLAVLLIWVEMSVMISAAVLFSTLTSPLLASIYSLAFYIAGHLNDLLSLKLVEHHGSFYPLLLRRSTSSCRTWSISMFATMSSTASPCRSHITVSRLLTAFSTRRFFSFCHAPCFRRRILMGFLRKNGSVTALVAAALIWCMIAFFQRRLTDIRQDHFAPSSMAYVPQTGTIKPFLLGFHSVFADYLWIRTTLYFGDHVLTDQQYPWLIHMVDLVTRLNPHFYPAYEFAGLMLPDVCKNPGAAHIILERGVSSDVEHKWKLYYYLGMLHYRYYDDRQMAATYLACAATQKNSPGFRLSGLAAAMFRKAGSPEEGKAFLAFAYALSENPEVKRYIRAKMERQ